MYSSFQCLLIPLSQLLQPLSSTSLESIENPYDVLLRETYDDPKEIQARYENHRIKRIEQQKEKLLDAAFEGLALDTILQRLLDPLIEPGFVDPRHSITVWARPAKKVKELAVMIQERLLSVAPSKRNNFLEFVWFTGATGFL